MGVPKGISTELLLAHLTETWRQAVDSGLFVGVAFIDFKKAFDCVNHDILLNTHQYNFGKSGPFVAWLTNYLTTRTHYTVLNGHRSSTSPVFSGVPQGSVLGPTLFGLYTSDLVESVQSATVYMFACSTSEKVLMKCRPLSNQALRELYAWCARNKLISHPKK